MLPIKSNIKKRNQIEILRLLNKRGPTSRIDIADEINLTKASVTIITTEMIEQGLLKEIGLQQQENATTRGRRKILLDIDQNHNFAFGLVLENNQLVIGLSNLKGQSLEKKKISIEGKSYRDVLELIVELIKDIMKNNCVPKEKILGLGVCVSGGFKIFEESKTIDEKLARIKKDLSHAVSIKIATETTMSGSLIAQRIFPEIKSSAKSCMLIRYGEIIDVGLFINNGIYASKSRSAGGFALFQKRGNTNTYRKYLEQKETEPDLKKLTTALNRQLAQCIHCCHLVIDTDELICFGDYFEQENSVEQVNEVLNNSYKYNIKLVRGFISTQNIHLAGCAVAIRNFFYNEQE